MPEENAQMPVEQTEQPVAEWTAEENPEMAVMEQIVELISSLSAEGQRQIMSFLNQELWDVMNEEYEEYNNSEEAQAARRDAMNEVM